MGCGSGMTSYQVQGKLCWRRLRDWQQAGVWQKLDGNAVVPIARCGPPGLVPGLRGQRARSLTNECGPWVAGKKTGPNPTDRAKPGSKHHVLNEANGTPLSAILTGANRHDVTSAPGGLPLVEAEPAVRGQRGRRRPQRLYADRAYDSRQQRRNCAGATSRPPQLGGARNTAAGWECTAGWWNGLWGGCTSSAGCGCATSAAPTFMKPSCPSGVRSSAPDAGPLSVRGSKDKVGCTFKWR